MRELSTSSFCRDERAPPPNTPSSRGVCTPSYRVCAAAQPPCSPRLRDTRSGGAAEQWAGRATYTSLGTRKQKPLTHSLSSRIGVLARGAARNGASTPSTDSRVLFSHPTGLVLASPATRWVHWRTPAPLHATRYSHDGRTRKTETPDCIAPCGAQGVSRGARLRVAGGVKDIPTVRAGTQAGAGGGAHQQRGLGAMV
jgi:hypothetical protein